MIIQIRGHGARNYQILDPAFQLKSSFPLLNATWLKFNTGRCDAAEFISVLCLGRATLVLHALHFQHFGVVGSSNKDVGKATMHLAPQILLSLRFSGVKLPFYFLPGFDIKRSLKYKLYLAHVETAILAVQFIQWSTNKHHYHFPLDLCHLGPICQEPSCVKVTRSKDHMLFI